MDNNKGWDTHRLHVIHELERSNDRLSKIDNRLSAIENKLAVLDTKVYVATFFFSVVFTGVFNFIAGRI